MKGCLYPAAVGLAGASRLARRLPLGCYCDSDARESKTMGDWDNVPLGLRLQIIAPIFLCLIVGLGARVGLLSFAIASLVFCRGTNHPYVWAMGFAVCLVLMWLDAQRIDRDKPALKPGYQAILGRAASFLTYLLAVGLAAILFALLFAGWSVFDFHHLFARENAVAVVVSFLCLLLAWGAAGDLESPREALTLRGLLK